MRTSSRIRRARADFRHSQLYAASALSAQTFLRNMCGSVAPLYVTQLYDSLGYHGAGSLLAALATLLSVTPFILYRYGRRLRERSPFAVALAEERAAAARAPAPVRLRNH